MRKIEGRRELFAPGNGITALQGSYQTRRSHVDPYYVGPEDGDDADGAFAKQQQDYRHEILKDATSVDPRSLVSERLTTKMLTRLLANLTFSLISNSLT